MTKRKKFLYISFAVMFFAIVLPACCGVFWYTFCEEASFDLADASRLPRWFTVPQGYKRADVSVTMNTYIVFCGGCSIYLLHDHHGRILQMAYGKDGRLPASSHSSSNSYPAYTTSTVHGITEIMEYRQMGDVFYIADAPPRR